MLDMNKEYKLREIKQKIQEIYVNPEGNNVEESKKSLYDMMDAMSSTYSTMTAWDKIQIARIKGRPTAKSYIENIFDDFIELSGDRLFSDDKSIVAGLAMIDNQPITVIAQEKGVSTEEKVEHNFGMPHPEGYRKVLRLVKQAEKFRRPIVMFVDTPGAYPGLEAEERGQGEAIAKNLMELSNVKVPIITVIIGEGGSGGALAMAVADYIYMLEYAMYSVLSPEGFATILYKDASKAKEVSEDMKLTSIDLLKLKIIDEIVFEPTDGVQNCPEFVYEALKESLVLKIKDLKKKTRKSLVSQRYKKYRKF